MDEFEQGIDKAQKKFKSFSDNISGLSGKIDSVYSGMGDVLKPAADGFKAVESVGKKTENLMKKAAQGFGVVSTAVGGFGVSAVKSGMAFDATMSEVSAISGATGQDFQDLRDKALEMGAKTKFSASEAGEAMTYMAMAGWKTGDMLGGIEGIMNLAAASGEDLATTSDIVTDALTAFGMQASDSGHFADILAAASSNANTNVGMMGETFKYAAPLAGAMGYTAEDTALAIGLMANAGIKGSQSGTALRSIMTRLAKPTKESATAMDALGVSITNSDGSMKPFGTTISELRTAFSGLSEEQKATYAAMLGGQEAMSGLLAIVNAAPADVEKLTNALNDCNGAAEEMAATMIDNLQGDLTLLGSAFESLQIAISDSLTPTLREFAQFGQKAMAGLLEGFQGDGVLGFMAALKGIVADGIALLSEKAPDFANVSLMFIETLANGILASKDKIIASAKSIVSGLTDGIYEWVANSKDDLIEFGLEIVTTIFDGFTSAGEIISDNIGDFIYLITYAFTSYHEALFTVGMDILGAIGQGIVDNKEEIHDFILVTIENMVTSLRDNAPMIIEGGLALLDALVGAIEENMPLIIETGATIIGKLIEGISTASPGVQAIIATAVLPHILKIIEVVGNIGGAVSNVSSLVGGAINTIIGIGGKLMGGISKLFGLIAANPVVAIITGIVAAVVLLYTKCEWFRDAVHAVIDAVVGFFKGAWEAVQAAWSAAGEFFGGIVDGIKSAFDGIGEFLGGLFSKAWDAVKTAWGAAKEFFGDLWSGIKEKASDAASWIGDKLKGAWDGIKTAWGNAKSFFGSIFTGIMDKGREAAESVGDKLASAYNYVKEHWDEATPYFDGLWGNIKNVFGDAWEVFKNIGGNIVSGIKDGIASMWGNFTGWVKEKFDSFVGGVKNLLGIHSPSTEFAEIGRYVIDGMTEGMGSKDSALSEQATATINALMGAFGGMSKMFASIGVNAMDALSGSLGGAIQSLQNRVASLMTSIASAAKAALGIHSPSRVFAGIGENMALGLAEGWDDEYADIKRQIESGLNFGTATVGANASRYGGAQEAAGRPRGWGNTTVNIYSPEAVDGVQAARVWRKETQKMAIAYI